MRCLTILSNRRNYQALACVGTAPFIGIGSAIIPSGRLSQATMGSSHILGPPCRFALDLQSAGPETGRIMRLIHRSPCAANAVRTVSPGGELFVASVVICMILASFGDAVDPMWIGETELEIALFDLGGEFSVLAMRHWHLLQFLLGGAVLAAGISVLRLGGTAFLRPLRPAPPGRVEKVPIKL